MFSLKRILLSAALLFFMLSGMSHAVSYVQSPPFTQIVSTGAGDVKTGQYVQVPLITWGGDIATILANGNAPATSAGSIFDQKKLKIRLVRKDDFKEQVESYLSGETPYLRGTMGMINMAAEVLSRDPRTKPVIIYQLTWSNGGDCLVVKPGIGTARDLKGKSIALQAYGPHVDYLAKILNDAGLSMKDVRIRWVKDLTGTDNSPAEAFYEKDVDAAFMIIPDGLMLSSNGTVGTGAEGSVKGARIMLSTRTANRIISDVYAVRSDYFQAHQEDVEKFVHALMLARQELRDLFKNKQSRMSEYKKMLGASAQILLDSAQATGDAEALYADCEYVGFRGNVRFFSDENWPRNMNRLTNEIQTSLITAGLLGEKVSLSHAKWDYDRFRAGLTGIDDVEAPKFREAEVAKVVARKQAMGTLEEGELFSFEINFQPNQKTFSKDVYADEFGQVIELASTYGGAVITVEGHSDPQKYNKLENKGATPVVLRRTKQAAKNLSMGRALAVRNSIIKFAANKSVPLDKSQFTVIGHGIVQPKFPKPKTKDQWLSNMRVVFRIIQIEAEESVFEPLE
ncbi:MAG: nitrate ABC transporter substrate-binding protein [Desulfobacteraceae bacterium 4572_88]|nr:MAG: nitrate ABC transporter substrate-binding protein [Desulfobacteraceae bacterium 4572_88]